MERRTENFWVSTNELTAMLTATSTSKLVTFGLEIRKRKDKNISQYFISFSWVKGARSDSCLILHRPTTAEWTQRSFLQTLATTLGGEKSTVYERADIWNKLQVEKFDARRPKHNRCASAHISKSHRHTSCTAWHAPRPFEWSTQCDERRWEWRPRATKYWDT